MSVLQELGLGPQSTAVSWPLQLEAYRRVDPVQHQPRSAVILVENWHHDHRSMLWSDLHKLLKSSLPQDALHFGHEVCQIMQNSTGVNVVACTRQADGSPVEKNFACDYVIAADGVNSFVRRQLLPTDRKRCCPPASFHIDFGIIQKAKKTAYHTGCCPLSRCNDEVIFKGLLYAC